MLERVYSGGVSSLPVSPPFSVANAIFTIDVDSRSARSSRNVKPTYGQTGNFTAYGLDSSTCSIRLVEIGRRPIRLSASRFHTEIAASSLPFRNRLTGPIPVPLHLTLFYSVSPFVRHAFVSRWTIRLSTVTIRRITRPVPICSKESSIRILRTVIGLSTSRSSRRIGSLVPRIYYRDRQGRMIISTI